MHIMNVSGSRNRASCPGLAPAAASCTAALQASRQKHHGVVASAVVSGYTASDAPEKRKNTELYTGIVNAEQQGGVGVVKPEVLAPAGGWAQLRAAVENGADAVYFGLTAFNARARADNFTADTLPDVVTYCHERGVRAFVTLNVLVFDEELAQLEAQVRVIAAAGVDSVIVQDVGVVEIVRRVAPNLTIHGSTQMSVTSGEGAEFARELGCKRVVVGRELSTKEIAKTVAQTGAEVEVFVHGALCVSYSGQCFSSEAWGGRSANRGQCAQACRLPYGLLVNGTLRELSDVKYLLSPQDLMAVEQVPDLIRAGVTCFKIEGRLKGPEYVALTTQVYRLAVDTAWEQLSTQGDVRGKMTEQLPAGMMEDLTQVFARGQDEHFSGLTAGFLDGVQHQMLVRGRNPRHRGVCLGRVERVVKGMAVVRLQAGVKAGDGVVFDCGDPERPEEGGNVVKVRPGPDGLAALAVNGASMECVRPGDLVWRSKDATLEGRLRGTYEKLASAERKRTAVVATLRGTIGEQLTLRLRGCAVQDADGNTAEATSSAVVQPAAAKPTSHAQLLKAVGSTLGPDTVFTLQSLNTDGLPLAEDIFIPMGEVKSIRRAAVEQLTLARQRRPSAEDIAAEPAVPQLLRELNAGRSHEPNTSPAADTKVRVLCRTRPQVDAALTLAWLDEVTLDFLEVHGLREAVVQVRAAGKRVVVATPRVLKPDEQRLWRFYLGLQPDALLLRSAGLLQQLLAFGGPGAPAPGVDGATIPDLMGDFSLNAANVVSASTFFGRSLSRLTPTHDLNAAQLAQLGRSLPAESRARLEAVVHQHLPIFHTEHCVFCRFLSDGNSYKDCGHPCEGNAVHLRDGAGKDHLVLADMGCRNTVFNAQAQSALPYLQDLMDAGYRSMRVELVDEPADVVASLLQAYHDVVQGQRSATHAWKWIQQLPDANGNVHGCSQGSLAPRQEVRSDSMKQTAAARRAQDRPTASFTSSVH